MQETKEPGSAAGSRTAFALTGGVLAAFSSALCCAGPLLAVTAGVSGAGLSATFEPLRPWFLGATALSLGWGFWQIDRAESGYCTPGQACAVPAVIRRRKRWLWIATIVSLIFASYPRWSVWVLGR